MTDKDYAPLSAVCVRTLSDKVYEKRKAAAFEIEKLTRECVALQNHTQIQKLLKLIGGDFVSSHNPNTRKGALVGLAAIAIALGKETNRYTNELVKPILICMSDTDSRVRYYACESLYNVTKVARENILPLFNDVFSAMSIAITDADQNVRTATELLVKLSMNIVAEQPRFDMDGFMPVLKERMYSKSVFARQFHLGWLSALRAVPDSQLLKHLPGILDQLFTILSDDTKEIRTRCDRIMMEFLTEIKSHVKEESNSVSPSVSSTTPTSSVTNIKTQIEFSAMINILILHAQSHHVTLQIMAAQWIHEFVKLSGNVMLPHMPGILMAQLPNLVFDDERRRNMTEDQYKRIRELSNTVNLDLMKLVRKYERELHRSGSSPFQQAITYQNKTNATESNPLVPKVFSTSPVTATSTSFKESDLKLESLVKVLTEQLQRGRVETKLAVLRWIYHLFNISRPKMVNFVDQIFPVLLKTLSDSSDEVLILNLQVLAEICCPPNKHANETTEIDLNKISQSTATTMALEKSKKKREVKKNTEVTNDSLDNSLELHSTFGNTNPHFSSFILSLLKLFRADRNLLDTKGSFIIRQLCMLLSAEDIYRSLAELLLQESNLKFARLMVETLNTILLTTSELFELRNRLRNLSSQESCELFTSLYRTWSHSPIATIALCLLTGCYRHAGDLVRVISDQEVTLEMLTELDRLVQLIESPIFTYLRMELLDVETNNDLLHALQALLMLLPQSNAFRILRDRLNCLQRVNPNFTSGPRLSSTKVIKSSPKTTSGGNGIIACRVASEEIDFHALLNHFKAVQQNHLDLIRAQSQEQQLTRGVKILDLSDTEEEEDREDSEDTNKYSL